MDKVFVITGDVSYYLHVFRYGGKPHIGRYEGKIERVVVTDEQTTGDDNNSLSIAGSNERFLCPCCRRQSAKSEKAAKDKVAQYGRVPLVEVHRHNSYEPRQEVIRGVIAEEAVPSYPQAVIVEIYTETWDVHNNRIFHPDPRIRKVATIRDGEVIQLELDKAIPGHILLGLGDRVELEGDSVKEFPELKHGPAKNFCGGNYCSVHKNEEVCDGFKTSKYGRCSYQDGEPDYEWIQEPQALAS